MIAGVISHGSKLNINIDKMKKRGKKNFLDSHDGRRKNFLRSLSLVKTYVPARISVIIVAS